MNECDIAKAVVKKLSSCYEQSPEANLMFSIIGLAILDLYNLKKPIYDKAGKLLPPLKSQIQILENYFYGPMLHANLINIDPEYIQRILVKSNILSSRELKAAD